jgi:hypothetical protein
MFMRTVMAIAGCVLVICIAGCGHSTGQGDVFVGTWRPNVAPTESAAKLVITKLPDGYRAAMLEPGDNGTWLSSGWIHFTRDGNELRARTRVLSASGKPTRHVWKWVIDLLPSTGHLSLKLPGTYAGIELVRVSSSTWAPSPLAPTPVTPSP